MGIIMIIIAFDPSGTMQRIAGQKTPKVYQGFENQWYLDQGKGLCLTLLMSAVSTNAPGLGNLINALIKQIKDRGWKSNVKKDIEDEYDDEVNTKIKA